MKLFDDVVIVELRNTHASDATLGQIDCLTNLQILAFSNTSVTDVGLAHLKGLTDLRAALALNNWPVTDAGFRPVSRDLQNCKCSISITPK